jgi:peptidoglycan/xylan/chitin deacetylase (PgdA/CDA1 family)
MGPARPYAEDKQQKDGQNSRNPAPVELAYRHPLLEENMAHEEPGQDEEEVDAHPADDRNTNVPEMRYQNQQYCQAPPSVEIGKSFVGDCAARVSLAHRHALYHRGWAAASRSIAAYGAQTVSQRQSSFAVDPKAIVKRTVVRAIARIAPLTWRWRSAGSLVVLMYHRVLPKDSAARGAEQPGMYVSPETLDLHLAEVKRRFELMYLDEWLRRAAQGSPLPRLACAITFDDGWRDNYDFALPVLAKHGAPATIFLVSSYIGTTYRFWPNRLMSLLQKSLGEPGSVTFPEPLDRIVKPALLMAERRGELRADEADAVVQCAKGLDEAEIRSLIEAAERSCGDGAQAGEILNGEQVVKLGATGLVRFGSHTATHFRLGGQISTHELEREIVGSRQSLQDLCGQPIDIFCYPNGETSPGAIDMVRRHYLGAVTTHRGWHNSRGDPYLIGRIGVHDDVSANRDAFLERLAGWL